MTTTAHPVSTSTPMMRFRVPSYRQRGVSLLEVLIAVVVLSFGLVGLAGLQLTSLRNNQSSLERSNAVMQIYSIADVMRADIAAAANSDYNVALGGSLSGTGFAATQVGAWQLRLQETLGAGAQGSINCSTAMVPPNTVCTITIRWDDSLGTGGSAVQTLTTEVQL